MCKSESFNCCGESKLTNLDGNLGENKPATLISNFYKLICIITFLKDSLITSRYLFFSWGFNILIIEFGRFLTSF